MGPLPRLCYLGEVPVECSYHGSVLLWRLFETYPPKDLLIIEGIRRSSVDRRLPGVRYLHHVIPGLDRALRTRYGKPVWEVLYWALPILASTLALRVAYEKPDAIITVCNGLYWLVAARVSNILKLPLHVIVHDHVPV